MNVLEELLRARGLYATCPNPNCGRSFVIASLWCLAQASLSIDEILLQKGPGNSD
jgi:hypothetical protein